MGKILGSVSDVVKAPNGALRPGFTVEIQPFTRLVFQPEDDPVTPT
jgi:hypothetical protein